MKKVRYPSFLRRSYQYIGCLKSGRIVVVMDASVNAYRFSLLLSPVVSVWDCIVRKMGYSLRPEFV
ncbi:hypothetical protein ACLOJK_032242 [Asimina triloba]